MTSRLKLRLEMCKVFNGGFMLRRYIRIASPTSKITWKFLKECRIRHVRSFMRCMVFLKIILIKTFNKRTIDASSSISIDKMNKWIGVRFTRFRSVYIADSTTTTGNLTNKMRRQRDNKMGGQQEQERSLVISCISLWPPPRRHQWWEYGDREMENANFLHLHDR